MKPGLAVLPDNSFVDTANKHGLELTRTDLQTLQVNLGKLCNQACLHCHVEAGPKRTEIMEARTAKQLVQLLHASKAIGTIDITGGAPEMCPEFKNLVREASTLGLEIIDRCNLTILFEEGYSWVAPFLADYKVTVVASLPCYTASNVEKQRGRGVFQKSIDALKWFNELGYGQVGSDLKLHLVYNPTGASLPPSQATLESDYKTRLMEDFGIHFNKLFTITNMPIKRFLHDLERQGKYDEYMCLLRESFNPMAAKDIMCRSLVSIAWDGTIYDCDFNQMLEIPLAGVKTTIWDISSFDELDEKEICFADHCYGCTAGAGSSCTGSLSA